ncbi:MAG: cytochrome C [Deltaproteobacteria bacterium]|nr:cytochrome C [Deltaproteobacteria bacterium]
MEKRKFLLEWVAGILIVFFLVVALGIEAREISEQTGEQTEKRSDLLAIDTMKSFGALERPEVVFLHDLHTDALEKQNKDCKACHLPEKPENGRLSPKFKRIKDTGKQAVMDIYHTNCLGCHKELSAAGQTAGPVEICGDCHGEKPRAISSRQPMGFDKSLHFRHTKATAAPSQKAQGKKDKEATKGDCGLCHHEYDEKAKKLFYAKEKEGSCRYCHRKETAENRISMRLASHSACIDCHKKTLAENKKAGPVKCSGCHDLKNQQMIEKIEPVPRIERKQPDIVLIKTTGQETSKEALVARMNPVPFDHKAHEEHNDTCIVCHHESLDSCSKKCHTQAGSKEGKYVNLEQAMHQKGYEKSCLGCHEINKNQPQCAGCHAFIGEGRKQASSCLICHMEPVQENPEAKVSPDEKMIAEMLKSRKTITYTYKDEDIPEKVIIKKLEDKYQPVEFPHRKIVQTLFKTIKDNKLANYFHPEFDTVCMSCHHNSPPGKKPPSCGSCHGKPFDERNIFRPGLKGAYHQQCMGCHKKLELEKPKSVECTDCHKEKKKPVNAS